MPSEWPTEAVAFGRKGRQRPEMTPAALQLIELLAAEIAEELLFPTPENEKTRAPTTASLAFSNGAGDAKTAGSDLPPL